MKARFTAPWNCLGHGANYGKRRVLANCIAHGAQMLDGGTARASVGNYEAIKEVKGEEYGRFTYRFMLRINTLCILRIKFKCQG